MRWIIRLLLCAVALYLTSLLLNAIGVALSPDVARASHLSSLNHPAWIAHMALHWEGGKAAIAIIMLSVVNALVRPVIRLLSLPLTLATLGLSSVIINGLLFWAVGHFTGGYDVEGVLGLLLGPIVVGVITGLLSFFVRDREKR